MPRLSACSMPSFCFYTVWKACKNLLSNSAFPPWNHALFTSITSFFPLPTRMYYLLYRKAMWFINAHATVAVGMQAVPPKGCRAELNITSLNLSALALLFRNAYFQPVGANLLPRPIPCFLLLIQPLDFTCYKILSVLNIMMTVDSLFLPKVALLSIYLLWKPLSSKLLTPPSADKKNSCTA